MTTQREWNDSDAARLVSQPALDDDKYSRGVLGLITGSAQYPGAAVLGVEAALRTGVGMVRYVGPERAENLVLQRRPEAVMAWGRVQAWLIGSGMDPVKHDDGIDEHIDAALSQSVPAVVDGGALAWARRAQGPTVVTPHYRELARMLDIEPSEVAADPQRWAVTVAQEFEVTVLLKGHTTFVTDGARTVTVSGAPTWLATAGAGDALGGILGALVATHSEAIVTTPGLLVDVAASASFIHGRAAQRASNGGPLTVLDLCVETSAVIADLVERR